MRWIYIFIALIAISISGCTKTQQVFIPTACEIPKRERPQKSGDMLEDLKAIFIYSELLERDLEFCRGVKNEKQ